MKAKKRNSKVVPLRGISRRETRKTKQNKSFLQTLFVKTNDVLRAAFAENGK